MEHESNKEQHHDDVDSFSMEAGKSGIRVVIPRYWSKWVGPILPWTIFVFILAVSFAIIMFGISLVLGGDFNAFFRDHQKPATGTIVLVHLLGLCSRHNDWRCAP